jgi:hypothetical protein
MSEGNGDMTEQRVADTVLLSYDRETDTLTIGGNARSLNLVLDMLTRAAREIESQWRQQKALELQARLQDQQRNAALAASLFTKG